MSSNSISTAIRILQDLLAGLEQAFWESNNVDRKDYFYDLISAIQAELSELNKLSVQDHDLEYEPITERFTAANSKLSRLRKLLDEYVLHSSTAVRLEGLISETVVLLVRKDRL